MTENPYNLAWPELGTVGSGVYETLYRNHSLLEARSKIPFRIKRIAVRNLNKHRETAVPEELLTDDWHELVGDPEIDIIIELIRGTWQADLVTTALRGQARGDRQQGPAGRIRRGDFQAFRGDGHAPITLRLPPGASPSSRASRTP